MKSPAATQQLKPIPGAKTTPPTVKFTRTVQLIALGCVCLAQFLCGFQMRSILVMLPSLAKHFVEPINVIQWASLAFQIVLVGLALTSGRLGDVLGRRRLLLVGFGFLGIGSLLAGLSTELWQFFACRVLQAIGAAALTSNGRAMLAMVFPMAGRGRAIGLSATSVALGGVTGTVVAGVLLDAIGWRWLFILNFPIAAVGFAVARWLLPETTTTKARLRIDFGGMVTLFFACLFLLLGLVGLRTGFNAESGGYLGAAALFLVLLVLVERRVEKPLLQLGLFRLRILTMSITAQSVMWIAQTTTLLLLPFYLQYLRVFSATIVGWLMFIPAAAMILLAPVSGTLSDRFNSRNLMALGSLSSLAGMAVLSELAHDSSLSVVVLALVLMGLGFALFNPVNNTVVLSAVPSQQLGSVSGIISTNTNLSASLGVAVGSLLLDVWLIEYGVSTVPTSGDWLLRPVAACAAFTNVWRVITVFSTVAVLASLLGSKSDHRSPPS